MSFSVHAEEIAQLEASCLLEFPVLIHVLSHHLSPNLLQNQQSQLFCIKKKLILLGIVTLAACFVYYEETLGFYCSV